MHSKDRRKLAVLEAEPVTAAVLLEAPKGAILGPLERADEEALTDFFEGLSARSRHFFSVRNPAGQAHEHCEAIARYDKLRLVVRNDGHIIGLSELSLDITWDDIDRFACHGIALCTRRDCRWGLCIADEWQRRGLGTAISAPSFAMAQWFGRERVVLWGGVHTDNVPARAFYRGIGFRQVGSFTQSSGIECVDMIRELVSQKQVRDELECTGET